MVDSLPAPSLYDLIHLIGGYGEGKGFAVVFVCYLDDSDDRLSTVTTLAGYLAPLEGWSAFEEEVEPVFERYGVSVLHTINLHGTKGDFEGWSRIKKQSFVDEVYAIASNNVYFGIAVSARKNVVKKWKNDRPKNSRMSPYGVCFASLMHSVVHNHTRRDQVRREGVSFVVESGHRNNGEIEQYFHRWKKDPLFKGYAHSITFAGKDDSRAIQLADFFAFHARRTAHRTQRFDGKLIFPDFPLLAVAQQKLPHFARTLTGNIRPTTRAAATNPELRF